MEAAKGIVPTNTKQCNAWALRAFFRVLGYSTQRGCKPSTLPTFSGLQNCTFYFYTTQVVEESICSSKLVASDSPTHSTVLNSMRTECGTDTACTLTPTHGRARSCDLSEPCWTVLIRSGHVNISHSHPPSSPITLTHPLHVTIHLHCIAMAPLNPVLFCVCLD